MTPAYGRGVTAPAIGQPLPRARDAHCHSEKWCAWILAPHGHGKAWADIFHVGPAHAVLVWNVIPHAVLAVPVSTIRDRAPYGVVCGVRFTLSLHARTAPVVTAWHYAHGGAAPRLVTAYPAP